MVEPSESFGDNSGFCSLCERCVAENNSSPTICTHRNSTPFLRDRIFLWKYNLSEGNNPCGLYL